jgi:hypothetical protein
MPNGGEFIIRTDQVILDEVFATLHGDGKPGAYALVTVSDTGAGMDNGVAAPMRQPKFVAPTKANSGGAMANQMTYLKKIVCGSGRVSASSSNRAAG